MNYYPRNFRYIFHEKFFRFKECKLITYKMLLILIINAIYCVVSQNITYSVPTNFSGVVPNGVCKMELEVVGGKGGSGTDSGTGGTGGMGGLVRGNFSVVGGMIYKGVVASVGGSISNGQGAGGGGGSSGFLLNNVLIAIGAGGGGGGRHTDGRGGAGGGRGQGGFGTTNGTNGINPGDGGQGGTDTDTSGWTGGAGGINGNGEKVQVLPIVNRKAAEEEAV